MTELPGVGGASGGPAGPVGRRESDVDAPSPEATPPRGRLLPLLPQLAWEGVLLVGVLIAVQLLSDKESGVGLDVWTTVTGEVAVYLPLVVGLSLTVRVGAPNLALGTVLMMSSVVCATVVGTEDLTVARLLPGAIVALLLSALPGVFIGGLVAGLRVPDWAASLVAVPVLTWLTIRIGGREAVAAGLPVKVPWVWHDLFWMIAVVGFVLSVAAGVLLQLPRFRALVAPVDPIAPGGAPLTEDGMAPAGPATANSIPGSRRTGLRPRLMVFGAILVNTVLAGVGGVLLTLWRGFAVLSFDPNGIGSTVTAVVAVLLAGTTLYRRFGAVAGTALATVLLVALHGRNAGWATFAVLSPGLVAVLAVIGLLAGRVLDVACGRLAGWVPGVGGGYPGAAVPGKVDRPPPSGPLVAGPEPPPAS